LVLATAYDAVAVRPGVQPEVGPSEFNIGQLQVVHGRERDVSAVLRSTHFEIRAENIIPEYFAYN
jgi:hypothetical protein